MSTSSTSLVASASTAIGLPDSLDSILGSFKKVSTRLERFENAQRVAAQREADRAHAAQQARDRRLADADKAKRVRSKIQDLVA